MKPWSVCVSNCSGLMDWRCDRSVSAAELKCHPCGGWCWSLGCWNRGDYRADTSLWGGIPQSDLAWEQRHPLMCLCVTVWGAGPGFCCSRLCYLRESQQSHSQDEENVAPVCGFPAAVIGMQEPWVPAWGGEGNSNTARGVNGVGHGLGESLGGGPEWGWRLDLNLMQGEKLEGWMDSNLSRSSKLCQSFVSAIFQSSKVILPLEVTVPVGAPCFSVDL